MIHQAERRCLLIVSSGLLLFMAWMAGVVVRYGSPTAPGDIPWEDFVWVPIADVLYTLAWVVEGILALGS